MIDYSHRMEDNPHVFLIKDKIRCIQKKIMDQLAADLNSALNDANMLTSSVSNITMASMNSSKSRRRRKRPNPTELFQRRDASDSTTPDNNGESMRHRLDNDQDSFVSDPDEIVVMPAKTQSSSLAIASESDSTSQTDALRRRRRPFKKPLAPQSSMIISGGEGSTKKLIRSSHLKSISTDERSISATVRRRRPTTRSDNLLHCIEHDGPVSTPSSSPSLGATLNKNNFIGKRKRSRAIHDDFRLRNSSAHDYEMSCVDETNLANLSSGSSLNWSDSDKEPCLTSNEADDEQSDWPRDESGVPKLISWWDEKTSDQESDQDEKMLTTTDGTLQKIVNGALNMMLTSSKASLQNRIKHLVNREMLTGNRRHVASKSVYTHPHSKRHVRLLKDTRRSHHHSYNHKRVKSDHCPTKTNEPEAPIDSMNIGHQLLEKIGWTPGNGLGLKQDGITIPIQINYRHHRQGLGYENTPMDTSERPENDQTSFPPSQPSTM